jgi:hypothetical protein
VNLAVMIFIFDEKLGTRRDWHRAKTVGLCASSSQLISTAQNSVGTFQFLEKRVKYRISTKFK